MTITQEEPSENQEVRVGLIEKDLDRLVGWVRAAESRLALVLPLSMAMLGTLSVLAPAASKWTVEAAIFASFAGFFLMLAIACAAFAFFPRTSGPKGSLVYFQGIVTRNLEQYRTDVHARTERDHVDDLISQCYRNAQIADRKYKWVQRSIAYLSISAIPWSIALFLLYYAKP